jgi:hypothetical protein
MIYRRHRHRRSTTFTLSFFLSLSLGTLGSAAKKNVISIFFLCAFIDITYVHETAIKTYMPDARGN